MSRVWKLLFSEREQSKKKQEEEKGDRHHHFWVYSKSKHVYDRISGSRRDLSTLQALFLSSLSFVRSLCWADRGLSPSQNDILNPFLLSKIFVCRWTAFQSFESFFTVLLQQKLSAWRVTFSAYRCRPTALVKCLCCSFWPSLLQSVRSSQHFPFALLSGYHAHEVSMHRRTLLSEQTGGRSIIHDNLMIMSNFYWQ